MFPFFGLAKPGRVKIDFIFVFMLLIHIKLDISIGLLVMLS